VDAGQPVTSFFGSWFEIYGKSQAGYFLGYEAIKDLGQQFSLEEIALLENTEGSLRPILKQEWTPK
jgi:hypothetical protein